jgi:hypothetical protein
LVADTPPDANAKQYAVTALGGTQTGVVPHSVAAPFTTAMFRPKAFKPAQLINPLTGALRGVGTNSYSIITRKGVLPLAGQPYKTMIIRTIVECPVGADTADPLSVRAALSMHFGSVAQATAGIGDTVVNGVL